MTDGVFVPPGKQTFTDPLTNVPLVGGLVYMYVPATSTPKDTYQDEAQGSLNTNPIVLDANGQCTIWGTGLYRQLLKRADASIIWDQVTGFAGGGGSTVTFATPAEVAAGASTTEVISPNALKLSGVLGGSGTTVMVGNGTRQRTLNVSLSDYANVNDYLNTGDTNYNGAITRALAAKGKAYFPAGPSLGGSAYVITASIAPSTGQALLGDGSDITTIQCNTANTPVIAIGPSIQGIAIRGMTVTHSGTATAGGDGIAQAQGLFDWINDGLIFDVRATKNYIGFNFGKAFYCDVNSCTASLNVNDGFRFTTTGNSTVPVSVAAGGPLQFYLTDCISGSNGHDGFAYLTTGTGFGGSGVGSSVGTLESCKTFKNAHHGVAYYGTAAHPLNSARVSGGFFGEDLGNCIYLDTFARNHLICPDFVELAGQYAIEITFNNSDTVISAKVVTSSFWDGVISFGNNTVIDGGTYINNGLAGTGVDNFAGINIQAGNAIIDGVTSQNFNSTFQQYGIRTNVDDISVTGCRLSDVGTTATGSGVVNGSTLSAVLIGNAVGPIFWPGGVAPTFSVAVGCLPLTANTSAVFSSATIAGNLTVTGTCTVGTNLVSNTATHLNGPIAINGGMTLVSGASITGATSGITVRDIQATRSMGVGSTGFADGIDGHLNVQTAIQIGSPTGGFQAGSINVPTALLLNNVASVTPTYTGNLVITGNITASGTITATTDLVASGLFHANGASAFAAGSTWTGTNSITVGGGVTALDIQATRSMGVGSSGNADGVNGHLNVQTAIQIGSPTGGFVAGSINVPTSLLVNNVSPLTPTYTGNLVITGNITASGTITATTDLVANGTFHANGAAAFTSGGVNITAGGMTFTGGVGGNGITVDNVQVRTSLGVGSGAGALDGVVGHLAVGVGIKVGLATNGYGSGTGGTINVAGDIRLNDSVYINP